MSNEELLQLQRLATAFRAYRLGERTFEIQTRATIINDRDSLNRLSDLIRANYRDELAVKELHELIGQEFYTRQAKGQQ